MGMFAKQPQRAYYGVRFPDQPLPDVSPATTFGASQLGRFTGQGQVAAANELAPYGGDVGYSGPHTVPQNVQPIPDLPPASAYASRELHGGVTVFPSVREYVPGPPMAGGFTLMAFRPPPVTLEGERMQAQSAADTPASWREAPSVLDLCRRTGVTS